MRIIYSPFHSHHDPGWEFTQGSLVPAHETPRRAEIILERLKEAGLGPVEVPRSYPKKKLLAIHSPGLIDIIENGYHAWEAIGRTGAAFPSSWPIQGPPDARVPEHIDGKLAYYCSDTATPLTKTTWKAVKSSAACALTAADYILGGDTAVFALCRPPGHHAAANSFGGFCFLNNSAIAAQHMLDQGSIKKIAILDIDYHHGNGTQDIFYHRSDVFTVSIHAHPMNEYPFFWGHADETGTGAGEGFNLNLPLPLGCQWETWREALVLAIEAIERYSPDVLMVGLGVDTYKDDPISFFNLASDCYPYIGELIAGLRKPTLFVMEGGYAVDDLGINAVGVLSGFLHGNT